MLMQRLVVQDQHQPGVRQGRLSAEQVASWECPASPTSEPGSQAKHYQAALIAAGQPQATV